MGFYNQRCPNCSKAVPKTAEYCNSCGCPTATAWSSCHKCGSAVGAESKFCWKCGTEQDPAKRKQFYGDRWQRSPEDFAVRVELKTPGATLHHGLQVDEGTIGLVFQNGKFNGLLEPGYHTFDNVVTRLLGFDKGKEAHAVLIDTKAAEVDFQLEDIRLKNQVAVDARIRLLFRVSDPRVFIERVLAGAGDFRTSDLTSRFQGDVRTALQAAAQEHPLDAVLAAASARELIENDLSARVQAALAPYGLTLEGVRLAEFGGPAVDELRRKFGEIDRLIRELEANRRLQDAVRAGKVDAYRDEEQLKEAFDRISHDMGLDSVSREEERRRFVQTAEQKTTVEGLRLDYEARRTEIINRLDEQKLRHQSEISDAMHAIDLRRAEFAEDMRQQHERFHATQGQQIDQSKTDLEIARQGIEALKSVNQAKFEARKQHEMLDIELEGEKLKLRGNASMQALLATLSGEQGDRVLKLAELEMRKGLSVEQAMALVVEKSPEIAPAVAEAMRAKYTLGRDAGGGSVTKE